MIELECDAAIVGGGLVGSVLANALTELALDVALIESREPQTLEQPSFDSRATALANGSQRILESLGLWQALKNEAEPIVEIRISDRGHFGAAVISAAEEGVDALGYTVENRVLGEAFWARLRGKPNFRQLAPADVAEFQARDDEVTLTIERDSGAMRLRAKLMIAADGTHSNLRKTLGIGASEDDYGQSAVILNCMTERPLAGLALERFTQDGPLALLPLTRDRAAVVWTMPTEIASSRMQLPDAEVAVALEELIGPSVGRITRLGERACHRLARVRSDRLVHERVVLIGNAAVSLHPVAGQGFNLALRDVATLVDLMTDEFASRVERPDIGRRSLLSDYEAWRAKDQKIVAAFTHGLIRIFSLPLPGFGLARGAGLLAFDVVPGAKRLLARHTMGRAGRLPRLARGLSITRQR